MQVSASENGRGAAQKLPKTSNVWRRLHNKGGLDSLKLSVRSTYIGGGRRAVYARQGKAY